MGPFAAFAIAFLILLGLRQVALRLLNRPINAKHPYLLVLLNAVRTPSILWCLAGALEISIRVSELSQTQLYWASKSIGAFLIISISFVMASVMARMISVYGERNELAFALSGLSRTLTHIFVLSLGALMLLRHFEISVTPILAGLGVGGLAVALALQDTLANLFAGVHILMEEPIMLGDFIRLSTGEEGTVRDIGWRTTRIQTGANNMIVIPNTKITSGILTNYSLPDRKAGAEVIIYAGLDADANLIAQLAMEVAGSTAGVLPEPAPVVLFDPGITPTGMQLKLIFQVANHTERGGVQSAVRVRLFELFKEHQIPMPVMDRVVVVRS
jgi:small-conductance mechanosensitive channel